MSMLRIALARSENQAAIGIAGTHHEHGSQRIESATVVAIVRKRCDADQRPQSQISLSGIVFGACHSQQTRDR